MNNKTETYRKFIFIGIIIIALGITFTTTLKDTVGSLGTVLIAVGGLFFIIGMSKKRKEDERNNE
jgi:Sec-independent protein secretion pathway component TatC